ncbi:hypothetical protein CYMTET_35231, partial [Cymbomonas tetramitiformis]
MQPRHWRTLEEMGSRGRFCPDTEEQEEPPEGLSYHDWLRFKTTQAVETEINIQLGTYTIKSNHTEMLDERMSLHEDFKEVFGMEGSREQCARVQVTEARQWVRLVGLRHDCQYWVSDTREPASTLGSRKLGRLGAEEQWFAEAVQPYLGNALKGLELLVQADDLSEATYGYAQGRTNSKDAWSLKEVVVFRDPPAVHVYNVVEHGRRFYTTLAFTSDAHMCLQDFDPPTILARGLDEYQLLGGGLEGGVTSAPSLVISRSLNSELGTEVFIPARFLRGLLPECLLLDYKFWQSEDGSLRGYPDLARADPTKDPSMIEVEIQPSDGPDAKGLCTSKGVGVIRRRPLKCLPAEGAVPEVDEDSPVLTLINVLGAARGSALRNVAELMLRLDSAAQVLLWSDSDAEEDSANLAKIEFPRLGLSFTARNAGGEMRLYCEEFAGLYISNDRDDSVLQLLAGLPQGVLLQNSYGEMSVLVSATAKPLCPDDETDPFSGEILLARGDEEWVDAVGGVRYYLYAVHVSRRFLVMPTLAATLYLVLMRFLNKQYSVVFRLADSLVSDTGLSPEEQQIFSQLAFLQRDTSPDAHACRLKITLATEASRQLMPLPWNVQDELHAYVSLQRDLTACCRLSLAEEALLMESCDDKLSVELENRKNMLPMIMQDPKNTWEMTVRYGKSPELVDFDAVRDETCFERGADLSLTKVALVQYKRPEDMLGTTYLRFLNQIIDAGLDMSGKYKNSTGGGLMEGASKMMGIPDVSAITDIASGGTIGFMLCYELLTQSLNAKLLAEDNPHTLGCLLVRLMSSSDMCSKGFLSSTLRALSEASSDICETMPNY